MTLLEIIDFLNDQQYKNRTAHECGDNTFIKVTDVVCYSDKGRELLGVRNKDRLGWCVGFSESQPSIFSPEIEPLIKVNWWGNKGNDTLHRSFISKHGEFQRELTK